jgi:hypothetical protein
MRYFERPSPRYAIAVVAQCLVATLGLWFPWVENTPQYLDGEPYVTTPDLWGGEFGFDLFDQLLLSALVPALLGTLVFERWQWIRDVCVLATGTVVCWWVGGMIYSYWTVDHYVHRPGAFLALSSGLALCLLSVGAFSYRTWHHVSGD